MDRKLPVAIGIEDYKKIIEKPYYYVDKTLLIKEIIDNGGAVTLFTRPRRFGKTLALSMIKTFFETDMDYQGNVTDNSRYFEGLRIIEAGAEYVKHMGKYPVISLSLKSAKQPDFDMAYCKLTEQIAGEFKRHCYLLDENILFEDERRVFEAVMVQKATKADYATALKLLSDCLARYHNAKVIVLIDEYDVPLENAYFKGFYGEMVDFIRSLLESVLKTNESLEFAVITGCLRISKESKATKWLGRTPGRSSQSDEWNESDLFTGLNNLNVISVLDNSFSEYFGFTAPEVAEMLKYYGLGCKADEIRTWYDGYMFGNTEVYNPWSVINYIRTAMSDNNAFPRPYWSNTSSNSIVRELINNADITVKKEIECLLAGGTIEKPVHEDITYEDIYKTQDNLWNFLFFTGYLKVSRRRFENDTMFLGLAVPNIELKYIYKNTILEWFDERINVADLSLLYNAILEGDVKTIGDMISQELIETISYYDYMENYYHGFMAGLLKGCPRYIVVSNRESGNGRPDIIMHTPSVRDTVIIMEIKVVKNIDDMESGCRQALDQIEKQKYTESLYKEGYRKFIKYGVCFFKKECMVMKEC